MTKNMITWINLSLGGAPLPVYKGARGEAAGQGGGRAKGGVLLPPGVGLLLPVRLQGPAGLPLAPLYTGAGGTSVHTS